MDPEKLIGELSELMGQVNRHVSFMRAETEDIGEQWELLGNVGGQRADHAAQLLGRLRPHLRDLAQFCNRCETQIDRMVADPFCRKSA